MMLNALNHIYIFTDYVGGLIIYLMAFVYLGSLLIILFYSFMQGYLLIQYFLHQKDNSPQYTVSEWPHVTVQAPIYNEMAVIERLIKALNALDYPKDKLQIQILDDSTDETTQIAKKVIHGLRDHQHVDISIVRRSTREGYKAGALRDAMAKVKGEFIAIFDADFVPHSDFLKQTIRQFKNKDVGVVQTRWGHLNKQKMMLTELQAFGLNGHFSIEQTGRNKSGHFINFNGTGGVWRKKCIEDAGGWSADTLTEDLDLSYRAQMKGWKFIYLEDVESPAELPETITALKNQQHRWMKGGAECFLKNSKALLSNPSISFKNKLNGIFHLFNSSVFLCIFLVALLSVPIVFMRSYDESYNSIFRYESIFFVATLILYCYYYFSYRDKSKQIVKDLILFTFRFLQFLTISLGLSYNNAKAVFEAYRGKKTGFVRTPKFNNKKLSSKIADYPKNKFQFMVECSLLFYFLFGLFYAFYFSILGLIPFQLMLVIGYGYVVIQTHKDIFKDNSSFYLPHSQEISKSRL
jgi:cellulose synthase/poly-beta-1,6-N-acetylglucosamine synthase-like glycosyltransferase